MRDADKNGNALASDLALLEDRTALGQGEKKIYGSQIEMDSITGIYYVSPIIDSENVDKRRAKVGLQPLAEYISYWGLIWDLKKHVKLTVKIEAKEKNN